MAPVETEAVEVALRSRISIRRRLHREPLSYVSSPSKYAATLTGFEPELLADAFWLTNLHRKWIAGNLLERLWTLCILIMHYAKHPSSIG